VDVVFAAFDERAGPVAIFSTINDPVLTKKIAVKSIVSTLTSVKSTSSERLEGEAIIPFPDEKKLAFIFYSSLDQKTEGGENRVISISAIVENEQKSVLYTNATVLSQKAAQIKDSLNRNYLYGQSLSSDLTKQLQEWGKISDTQEMEIIAEKEIVFGVRGLFELFPAKRSLRSYDDPLVPLFYGLFVKIPVILVGPNVEFLLEISDLLRGLMPDEELDVRLIITLHSETYHHSISYGIPRADLILLNEEQIKKATFYREPVIIVRIGRDSRYDNYQAPPKAVSAIEGLLKKTRKFGDETVGNLYLQGEILAFFTKLTTLRDLCVAEKRGRVKDIANKISVKENYVLALAEALRLRREVSASAINKMFENETFFRKMDTLSPQSVGIVH
jgi:hypothetical protein